MGWVVAVLIVALSMLVIARFGRGVRSRRPLGPGSGPRAASRDFKVVPPQPGPTTATVTHPIDAPAPAPVPSPEPDEIQWRLGAQSLRAEAEAEAQMESLLPGIYSRIEAEAAELEAKALREGWEVATEGMGEDGDDPSAPVARRVRRSDYVPKEVEGHYLIRRDDGRLDLELRLVVDALAIWSPHAGGGYLNPKGPGLRRVGLVATYARGADYYPGPYSAADLRPGVWVDLRREPLNRHDPNAVALCAPGSTSPFAYVQRGRAPAVARRMDAGEHLSAISLHGPGPGDSDGTAFLLLGARVDLDSMLGG